jgi:hypothetical protein
VQCAATGAAAAEEVIGPRNRGFARDVLCGVGKRCRQAANACADFQRAAHLQQAFALRIHIKMADASDAATDTKTGRPKAARGAACDIRKINSATSF